MSIWIVHKYINMKKYFLNSGPSSSYPMNTNIIGVDSGLKNKSLFNPVNTTNQHVEVFKNLVLKDLDKVVPKRNINPPHIQEGIEQLQDSKSIVIRPAYKGGGVVILDKTYYDSQINEMLLDANTYVELKNDPTNAYRADLCKLVDLGRDKRVLNKKEYKYLSPSFCRIPTIYTLPKVPKDAVNPPARPIVNSIGSVTARFGQYLDMFLQASVLKTKAYLKGTKSFLLIGRSI